MFFKCLSKIKIMGFCFVFVSLLMCAASATININTYVSDQNKTYPSDVWEEDANCFTDVVWDVVGGQKTVGGADAYIQYKTDRFVHQFGVKPTANGDFWMGGDGADYAPFNRASSKLDLTFYNPPPNDLQTARITMVPSDPWQTQKNSYSLYLMRLQVKESPLLGNFTFDFKPGFVKVGNTGANPWEDIAYNTKNINIVAQQPPQNFSGPTVCENVLGWTGAPIGNTLKIKWTDLNAAGVPGVFANDKTPPVKYDIYLKEASTFDLDNASDNNTNDNKAANGMKIANAVDLSGAEKLLGGNGVLGTPVLSDCTTYYFRMRAKDSTTDPNALDEHKTTYTDKGGYIVSEKPHDYTPPHPPVITTITEGDGYNTINWKNPDDNDFQGCILLRKASSAPLIFPVASGDDDGPDYKVGDILFGAKIIEKGKLEQKKDDGNDLPEGKLTNGIKYYYAIHAYDTATEIDNGKGTYPRQQGRNYSTPGSGEKTPGVPPPDVENIRALADPKTGDISVLWTNPILDGAGNIDANKAKGYGGSLIVYTTDYKEWNNIQVNSATLKPDKFTEKDVPIEKSLEPTTQKETSTTFTNCSTTEIYYFKVFSYNIVDNNDPAVRKHQTGVKVAAVPMKGGFFSTDVIYTGSTLEVIVNLKKKTDNYGINTIVFPVVPMYVGAKKIETIGDLVGIINEKAKAKVVTTIGYWDADDMKPKGFVFQPKSEAISKKKNIDGPNEDLFPKDIGLKPFVGYQVNVTATVAPITFKAQP